MIAALAVVAFVFALVLSVMLHEAGHFLTARMFGMKATRFFFGFGPTLWSVQRGETEYGVKAIPAGGFVKIVGMTPLEEVEPADEARAFYRFSTPRRSIVLAAGSITHFVIGFLLFFLIVAVIGTTQLSMRVASVSPCVPRTATAACTASDPPSPARLIGLRPGDTILGFAGHSYKNFDNFAARLRAQGARPALLVFRHDGRVQRRVVHLVVASRPSLRNPNRSVRVGVLGILAATDTYRPGVLRGLGQAGHAFGTTFVESFKALGTIPAAVPRLLSAAANGKPRGYNGLVGPVGLGRVSAQALTQRAPWSQRIADFLLLIAGLNVFIGIFNLLPLLPLDGGQLAIAWFETGRRRAYQLVRRPDPGRVDLNKLLPAAYLVIAVIVGLALVVLFTDIVNPIRNPFSG